MDYTVKLEKAGVFCPVGSLSEEGFQYYDEYLKQKDAKSVSISLPLRQERYTSERTKSFFEGLLPEGFSRKSVAEWMHVPENDYLAILAGLGRECLGAVMITDGKDEGKAGYRELTIDEVKALAAEGVSRSAKIVTESRLSLTGASGKVGLYYEKTTGKWYQPYGLAPSTHIVKQSHVRLKEIVINEILCQRTAQKCGIAVPECFILNTGGSEDGEILFVTRRYDRVLTEGNTRIDGLPAPFRLHQEDFAQAMGISPGGKYESERGLYLAGMFETLRQWSSNPLADQMNLWDCLIFNCLVGNTDNHLKNASLLYNENLSGIRLSPAYDLVSTTAYDTGTRRLSMRIGNARTLDEVNEQAFRQAAKEVQIGEKTAIRHLEKIASQFEKALADSARELAEEGFYQARKLKERILLTGGYRNFH